MSPFAEIESDPTAVLDFTPESVPAGRLRRSPAEESRGAPDPAAPRVYLNQAAESWPKAPGVAEAMWAALEAMPLQAGRDAGPARDPARVCREELARLLEVGDPERIILTSSATHALNLALQGLPWSPGQEVVTSVTEHNSVLRPLYRLRRRHGLRVRRIGLDDTGQLDGAEMERALARGPAAVVLNHVSNVTGRANDVARWFARARAVGAVTILDAAQSLGHLPVHPEELHADLVAFNGQKGLRGPPGTGGLYLRPGLALHPLLTGGTGSHSLSLEPPPEAPARYEPGTPNRPALAGWAAALAWHERQGPADRARERALTARLCGELRQVPGIRLVGCAAEDPEVGIVSLRLEGWDPAEAGFALQHSFGIVCRVGLHCAPLIHRALGHGPEGTLRLSLGAANQEEEIDFAVEALRRLARQASP